jgi:uncharacterized SAM-dependent methyltransferase
MWSWTTGSKGRGVQSEPCGSAYFESPEHEVQFVRCLLAGVVPPKFSYAGTAAYRHRALTATAGYQAVTDAVELEADMICRHIGLVGERQIAEIGPGTGRHTVDLLRKLSATSDDLRVRYLGLDFSKTMLDLASPVLARVMPTGLRLVTWDIDDGPTDAIRRWRSVGTVLGLLLGNTLANLDDPVAALCNARESLKPGDALLLSVNLAIEDMDPASIVAAYRTPEFRATILEPFRAAGVEAGELDIYYVNGELVAFVSLSADYRHKLGWLPKGRKIQCFRSRRFSLQAVQGALYESGFAPLKVTLRRSGPLAVVLASV